MTLYSETLLPSSGVQVLASDPSSPEDLEIWFNSTSEVVKYAAGLGDGVWSAGGNLATARYGLGGLGTQSAGLSFGGYTSSASAVTEEYNQTIRINTVTHA